MFAAFLCTLFFAASAICGARTAKQLGGLEANFWRVLLATIFLTAWAFTFGSGFDGAPGWFALSGFIGIGLGDSAYFQALPRLGSHRTFLLGQCLQVTFAALIEFLWLGSKLDLGEIAGIVAILGGVVLALKPSDHLKLSAREWKIALTASVFSALCNAVAYVLIRKAFQIAAENEFHPDAGTTGFQRMLGGIIIPTVVMLAFKWRSARAHGPIFSDDTLEISRAKWRRLWPWLLANALAGQTLGVTCMQWALKTTPAAIVTAIVAITPVVLLPMSRYIEREKIERHSIIGAAIAVIGVIVLTFLRTK